MAYNNNNYSGGNRGGYGGNRGNGYGDNRNGGNRQNNDEEQLKPKTLPADYVGEAQTIMTEYQNEKRSPLLNIRSSPASRKKEKPNRLLHLPCMSV